MDKAHFEREKAYQLTMSLVRSLLHRGLLTKTEYVRVMEMMAQKYQPVMGDSIADLA